MREIQASELKELEIGILNYIDSVCKKRGIVYSLAYGTMLGAVRHHGFIPWDDDIDICMDRRHFERFVEACSSDNSKRYRLLWLDTCDTYTLPLPKVIDTKTVLMQKTQIERMPLGVYVDVFVYDCVPYEESVREKFINKLELYQRFWGYSQNKYIWVDHSIKSFARFLVYSVFHLFNPRIFSKKLNSLAQEYNFADGAYLGTMVYSSTRKKERFSGELFRESIYMDFEGNRYPVTSMYDEYLRLCYGDYMVLPPAEKRVSNHTFDAFYLD